MERRSTTPAPLRLRPAGTAVQDNEVRMYPKGARAGTALATEEDMANAQKRTASTSNKNSAAKGGGTGQNEHNEKEHQERLAREAERVKPGTPGFNEHNAREHEEKMRRESSRR